MAREVDALAFFYDKATKRTVGFSRQQMMARLAAEVRDVDCSHRVGGLDRDPGATIEAGECLARLQDGQRTLQSLEIEVEVRFCHAFFSLLGYSLPLPL